MGLAGNISTISLAEVFQWLNTGQKTGTLLVQSSNGIKKEVYFKEGAINSASSSDRRELISQFVLQVPKLTESLLIDTVEKSGDDLIAVGKLLITKRFITAEHLDRILLTTSEEIIYDLFLWKEGQFEFLDNQMPSRPLPEFNLDIPNLIFEAARREDEWGRIKQILPDPSTILKPAVQAIQAKMPINEAHADVLRLVDGFSTANEIAARTGTTRFEAFTILMELRESGLIDIGSFDKQTVMPSKKEVKNEVEDNIQAIERLLDGGNLEEADRRLGILKSMAPGRKEVEILALRLNDLRAVTTAREMIGPQAVPVLAMNVDDITKRDLTPQETFLLSRINGSWDIGSIIKVAPYDEAVCFKVLKGLLDASIIKLN